MPESGSIPGDTPRERAVNLAGWLAEQGVQELTLAGRPLGARETDLPGAINAALEEAGAVDLVSEGLRVAITREECVWSRTPRKAEPDRADNDAMTNRPLTVAHVTHEAVVHMGGIGTVLQGLLTSPVYRSAVRRSILVGPLWDTRPTDDVNSRLGGDGARVIYSSLDAYDPTGLAAKLQPIELAYGVRAVYGTRVFRDTVDPERTAEAEVLLFDLSGATASLVDAFKATLFERFGIESHPFDHNDDFQQWVRLASPAYAALTALTQDDELPGVLISHEYMGMPAALAATLDRAGRFRTLFHGHECSTARHVVEHHPGHDAAFYPEMRRALEAGKTIEDTFGSQQDNYRHQLVSRSCALDGVIAVGDDTADELRFLSADMRETPVGLCYNGAPVPDAGIEVKLASRARVLDWIEPLLGYRPDYLFTHVTRPVISKGLWRDFEVCRGLDELLAQRGERAAYLLLTCGARPRTFDDATRMNREYGWPAHHREGYPDAEGPEVGLCRDAAVFNESAAAVSALVVNQFGFSRETLGESAPEGIDLADLRRAADVEFGLSVYEPFGIAPVEPLHAGAIAVVTEISGCAGFMRRAAGDLGLDAATHPNIVLADFTDGGRAGHATGADELAAIERDECARIAKLLGEKLPRNTSDRNERLGAGQRLAQEMSWDRVCEREFLPALRGLFTQAGCAAH